MSKPHEDYYSAEVIDVRRQSRIRTMKEEWTLCWKGKDAELKAVWAKARRRAERCGA